MKEFIKDLYIEPFKGMGLTGIIVGVLMWTLTISLITYLSIGIYSEIDKYGVEEKESTGVIVRKYYEDDFTTYTYSNGVMIPTYYPESFNLVISVGSKTDKIEVNRATYVNIKEKDTVELFYKEGKFNKDLYITKLK